VVIELIGLLEYWNVGILGLAELDRLLFIWLLSEIKIRTFSVFNAKYSIFPPFHHSTDWQPAKTTQLQ
jgi:hypothetical protein